MMTTDAAHRRRPAVRRRSRRRISGYEALGFPTWAYVVFFFVVPLGLVLWYSFGYKPDLFSAHANDVLSFDRYVEALDATFIGTFWNTLRIGVVGTLICLAHLGAVRLLAGREARSEVATARAGPGARAVLDQLPGAHPRLADHPVAARFRLRRAPEPRAHRRQARRALHGRRRAARRGLQLPAADDPAALRGHRPGRAGAARGQRATSAPTAGRPSGRDAAAGGAGHRLRMPPRVHPADGRLHHRLRARRGAGQHDRPARGQPVQHGPELGARLGDGRAADDLHRRRRGGLRRRRPHRARAGAPARRVDRRRLPSIVATRPEVPHERDTATAAVAASDPARVRRRATVPRRRRRIDGVRVALTIWGVACSRSCSCRSS